MKLVKPSLKYKDQFIKAVEEGFKEGSYSFSDTRRAKIFGDFEAFVNEPEYPEPGEKVLCPDGNSYEKVPQLRFWLVDDNDKFLGALAFRTKLNPFLLNHSGNLAYGIVPSEMGKGYATVGLSLLLDEARKLGLDKVLITARVENAASCRVIEKNGGVLENIWTAPWNSEEKYKRYWIIL